jgi:hypothetical protein
MSLHVDIRSRRSDMDNIINILGRRLDLTDPPPEPSPPHGDEPSSKGREPPDDLPTLVAV